MRQFLRDELRKVGAEGANVLRKLADKLEKMEKIGAIDMLLKVHDLAEALQMKIDEKSYLLVNTDRWDSSQKSKPVVEESDYIVKELNDIDTCLDDHEVSDSAQSPRTQSMYKSENGTNLPYWTSSENMFKKSSMHWPSHMSIHADLGIGDFVITDRESKTYESASSLSLATFASLLIEFVARLQYLVDSYQELSVLANFKEPLNDPSLLDCNV